MLEIFAFESERPKISRLGAMHIPACLLPFPNMALVGLRPESRARWCLRLRCVRANAPTPHSTVIGEDNRPSVRDTACNDGETTSCRQWRHHIKHPTPLLTDLLVVFPNYRGVRHGSVDLAYQRIVPHGESQKTNCCEIEELRRSLTRELQYCI
jgi:hypothetical protein